MSKAKAEKQEQKKFHDTFNNVTENTKVENQNQTHNSRKEGLGPNGKR